MATVHTLNVPIEAPAIPPLRPRPTLLTVRRVSASRWSVTSRDGRLGGTFRTQEAALHYAREEAVALPRAVLVIFGERGVTLSEIYEAHARVRVSAVAATRTRAA
jgi:hypothetical protein